MPTLTAIDTSVTDSRITLTFSHRATAQLYAKHLESEDRRNPSSFPGSYRRAPRFNPKSKEVSVALPPFITWFITCRLPDDEDSITFTFDDADEGNALRWAEGMVVFERVPAPAANSGHGAGYDDHDHDGLKQLHVRRLWNAERLQKRLEGLRSNSNSNSNSSSNSSPTRNAASGGTGRRGPTPGPQGPRGFQAPQQQGQQSQGHGVARANATGVGQNNGQNGTARAAGWWDRS